MTPEQKQALRACCRDEASYRRALALLQADAAPAAPDDEAALRALFEQVPLGAGLAEIEGEGIRHVLASEATAALLGDVPGSEAGPDAGEARRWIHAYHESAGKAREVQFEIRRPAPEGEQVIEVSLQALRDAPPGAQRFLYAARDVTRHRQTLQTLARNERLLRGLVEAAFEGLLIHGQQIVACNGRLAEMFGYGMDELIGRDPIELIAPDHRRAFLEHLQAGREEPVEALGVRRDGTTFPIEIVSRPYHHQMRDLLASAVRDVTARKQDLQRIAFQAGVLAQVSDAVVATDREGRVTYWNEGAERLYGVPAGEALGTRFEERVQILWRDEIQRRTASEMLARSGAWEGEVRLHPPGKPEDLHLALSQRLLRDDDGLPSGSLLVARDITPRIRIEEQLIHNAMHDALTGLANRTLFMNELWGVLHEREDAADRGYAVLFMDLDRFKLVNDSLGHHVGDQLLVQIAQRLKQSLRKGDLVARLGGDEFAVLVEPIRNPGEAEAVAERILRKVSAPCYLNGYEVFIDASIGIVVGSEHYRRPEDILRDADTAMYRAKELGTGSYRIFEPSMQTEVRSMLQLGTDLRRAVERQEFRAFYQPILHMATGRVAGFEALVRWQHPERGLLSPAHFIAFAEETGLIVPIERWVLQEAARQTRRWEQAFPEAPLSLVSVNVSMRQLQQPHFADYVRSVLDETGLPPDRLMLEITERVFMNEAEYQASDLPLLNRMQVQLCIDDFGTGFSSLSLLHGLPVQVVKLDRAFIARIAGNSRGLEMVRTIVRMAHALGLHVVAEGIETRAQLALLRTLGCTYGQGFLFSAPVDAEAATRLLSAEPPWMSYW